MKKLFISILIFTMLLGIVGCKNEINDDNGDVSKPNSDSSEVDNTENLQSDNNKPADTTSDVAINTARPEKVTKVYNVNFDFDVNDPIKEVFYDLKNGNSLPYALYVPKDYSASKKYPVILFLHGAGELGTDNITHLNNLEKMFLKFLFNFLQ